MWLNFCYNKPLTLFDWNTHHVQFHVTFYLYFILLYPIWIIQQLINTDLFYYIPNINQNYLNWYQLENKFVPSSIASQRGLNAARVLDQGIKLVCRLVPVWRACVMVCRAVALPVTFERLQLGSSCWPALFMWIHFAQIYCYDEWMRKELQTRNIFIWSAKEYCILQM